MVKKSPIKVAKDKTNFPKPAVKVLGTKPAGRSIHVASDWKKEGPTGWEKDTIGNKEEHDRLSNFQGLQVWYPVDPYRPQERKEFRSAMNNVYVYRAARILTTFVAGQGYTTQIVPRIEEELMDDQMDIFKQQLTYVPYWDEEMTFDQLKDRVDKMALDMDLANQVFNGYYTSLEQGRCVLALTPLDKDEETGKYPLPEEIRFVRTEFTLRPILDSNTAELVGCYVIGSRSRNTPSAIPAERMVYITHAFNNELFSDYYGDSKIARITDIGNNLNLVLNQDYERVAEQTWHKPNVWLLPIPPQNVGQEESILQEFLQSNNENAKGRDIAVAMSAMEDERKPEKIINSNNAGDIGGLETIRQGLIKAIITAFAVPAFMISEGDIGSLGGQGFIEEIDMFLNVEVGPERLKLENMLEKQYYDRILCILYDVEEPEDLPVKIKHKYNKPTLLTLLPPEMINSLQTLVQNKWIEPSALTQILHLEKYATETGVKGEATHPSSQTTRGWNNVWPNNGWNGAMPKGWESQPKPDGWGNNSGWGKENNVDNDWGGHKEGGWKTPSPKWGKIQRRKSRLDKATELDVRQQGLPTIGDN